MFHACHCEEGIVENKNVFKRSKVCGENLSNEV